MPTFQHPLAPPTLSGNNVTLDLLLNQPTRVNRFIQAVSLQRFAFPQLFSDGGAVSGGAVIYDQADINQLYPVNFPEVVQAGAEFPIIQDARVVPKVATVAKWGGKVFITDEARDRNDLLLWNRAMRKVANAMVRTIDSIAVAAINAELTARPALSVAGHSWSAVVTNGATPTNTRSWPHADIATVMGTFDTDELGESPDTILMNTLDDIQLGIIYGIQGKEAMLSSFGLTGFVSNRMTAGAPVIATRGGVGEYRTEKPLGTETWREPETERTWVQTSVRNVFFVTNPFAMKRITGVA
jgi:hypothetical protein